MSDPKGNFSPLLSVWPCLMCGYIKGLICGETSAMTQEKFNSLKMNPSSTGMTCHDQRNKRKRDIMTIISLGKQGENDIRRIMHECLDSLMKIVGILCE